MSYKYTPGETYKSRNEDQIETLTDQYINRGKFSYDPNADSAFQEYARQMRQDGKLAMEDTVAKASSMTGGYGNSYAATAGQQVYNNYLGQIGAAQGDFRAQALESFNAEGNDLLNRVSVLENREAADKAAWEEDYLNAVGMPVTDTELKGYLEAIKNGKGTEYEEYLSGMGYDITNLPVLANGYAAGNGYTGFENTQNDEGGHDISYTEPDTAPSVKKSNTVNDMIVGLNKYQEGENFHIKNTNVTGRALDVQLGNKVEKTDVNGDLFAAAGTKKGLVVYNDSLFYITPLGDIFEVTPQFLRGDEYTDLLNYMKFTVGDLK